MKEKLSKIKNRIKENAPELILATIAVASTTCVFILKQKLSEESQRFPEGGSTRLGVNQCCFDELKDGNPVVWSVNGHKIDIAYDPDC